MAEKFRPRQASSLVLITGNIFRDIFGWTYISEKRQRWYDNASITGGFGLYLDYARGIHTYRNISYNNAYTGYMFYGTWRDGDIVYHNNIAANSLLGFSLGGPQFDTHGNINTQILDNILVNNEGYGISFSAANSNDTNTTFDHNLYFNNGWRSTENGGVWKPGDMAISNGSSSKYYQTLSQIQASTTWEAQGVEGDPAFWSYNVADHDLHDGSLPDFHLASASVNAIDRGVTALPSSLTTLLTTFQVVDPHWGAAFDIGRYEGGFALLADPSTQAIEPGGTARYLLHAYPPDLPHAVALTVASPSPSLTVAVNPTILAPGGSAILTVSDLHTGTLQPDLRFTVVIAGNGDGFTLSGSVELRVGGARVYLPLVR